jgi:Tol biopolymer transport system component
MDPTLRLSPEGSRIGVQIRDLQTFTNDIWVYDLERTTLTRLTFQGNNTNAVWAPDGKRLLYWSAPAGGAPGLHSVPADNSSAAAMIFASEIPPYNPTSISPDGKVLIGSRAGNVWALAPDDPQAKPRDFLESQFAEVDAWFSPDGKWVSYQSNDSGREEIYVVPYPGPGGKTQISTSGGVNARWSRDGRELFYREGNKMMAVEVQTSPTFRAGTPKMLFESTNSSFYDVSPDGRRFVMVKPSAPTQSSTNEVHVVLNWAEELRRRVPLLK